MNHGLSSDTVRRMVAVFSHYPEIEKAVLYGSRAKGNFRTGSDIDLTLLGEKLDSHILGRVGGELDDLLLPYKLDLSIFHQLTHRDLIAHIRRVGKTFYEKALLAAGHARRDPEKMSRRKVVTSNNYLARTQKEKKPLKAK